MDVEYISFRQRGHPVNMLAMRATEKPRPWPVQAGRRLRYPCRLDYLKRYAHALWAALAKRTG